jgi:holo-[acyl-carrier protein] synthase
VGVVGVGVDALEIARMRTALRRTPGLAARLFTETERVSCTSRCGELRVGGLAARFAAKEAVAKALGTGLRGFAFRDIEVRSDPLGKPEVVLHDGAAAVAERLGVERVHVSLTTSGQLAIAHAVAEGRSGEGAR